MKNPIKRRKIILHYVHKEYNIVKKIMFQFSRVYISKSLLLFLPLLIIQLRLYLFWDYVYRIVNWNKHSNWINCKNHNDSCFIRSPYFSRYSKQSKQYKDNKQSRRSKSCILHILHNISSNILVSDFHFTLFCVEPANPLVIVWAVQSAVLLLLSCWVRFDCWLREPVSMVLQKRFLCFHCFNCWLIALVLYFMGWSFVYL